MRHCGPTLEKARSFIMDLVELIYSSRMGGDLDLHFEIWELSL